MEIKRKKNVPEIKGILRSNVIEVPSCIRDCSGIKIFGKRLKSFLFTTDVALIRNTNADAITAFNNRSVSNGCRCAYILWSRRWNYSR